MFTIHNSAVETVYRERLPDYTVETGEYIYTVGIVHTHSLTFQTVPLISYDVPSSIYSVVLLLSADVA